MTCDELRNLLTGRCVKFEVKTIQHGTRFDCHSGETFNVFNTGKMSFQGNQDTQLAKEIKTLYEDGVAPAQQEPTVPAQLGVQVAGTAVSPVFIVYGHDVSARDQLELILRRMGLEPVILGNLTAGRHDY